MTTRGVLFAQLFDYGVDVLATSLGKVTGIVIAQLGDSTAEQPDSDGAEWWQATGFYSRPAPPTQGGASCQGLVLKCGDRDLVFATSDKRSSQIYGNLAPGEACVFATVGQARSVWKKDGSVRHQTTDDNTAKGNAMFFGMSPVAANPSAKGGEWRVYAPFGGEWQDATGFHRQHWFGGTTDTGDQAIPGFPFPTTTLTESYDLITLDGAIVIIGRSNGPKSIPDQLIQTTIFSGLMAAFATAVGAFCGVVATFAGAAATYALGIKSVADPSNAVTPAFVAACGALGTAASTFAGAATTAFASIKVSCSTNSTSAT